MSMSRILIVLAAAALVGVSIHAAALPLPEPMARTLCKGDWVVSMGSGVSMCAFCEKKADGAPKCDYFVCEGNTCEWITVERKTPKADWKVTKPKLPKNAVAAKQ